MAGLRQYFADHFELIGGVLKIKQALLDSLGTGRKVWTLSGLTSTTSTTGVVIARIPWVPTDNPNYDQYTLHLRAVLYASSALLSAQITLTSSVTGQDLTIYSPTNEFGTASTTPVIVESNVDLFSSPLNVFDPSVDDILELQLKIVGGAGTASLDSSELILVDS